MCHKAVKQNGLSVQHVPSDILKDKELCYKAVKNNGAALIFIPDEIKRNDKMFELLAIERAAPVLEFLRPICSSIASIL